MRAQEGGREGDRGERKKKKRKKKESPHAHGVCSEETNIRICTSVKRRRRGKINISGEENPADFQEQEGVMLAKEM